MTPLTVPIVGSGTGPFWGMTIGGASACLGLGGKVCNDFVHGGVYWIRQVPINLLALLGIQLLSRLYKQVLQLLTGRSFCFRLGNQIPDFLLGGLLNILSQTCL